MVLRCLEKGLSADEGKEKNLDYLHCLKRDENKIKVTLLCGLLELLLILIEFLFKVL